MTLSPCAWYCLKQRAGSYDVNMHLRISAPQAFALSPQERAEVRGLRPWKKPLTLTLSRRERGKKQSLKINLTIY